MTVKFPNFFHCEAILNKYPEEIYISIPCYLHQLSLTCDIFTDQNKCVLL